MEPMKPMKPMQPMAAATPWWPGDLGQPSSSGAQGGMRYAFFSGTHRLLIEQDGKLVTYDSGDHAITGVSQAGQGQVPSFTTAAGTVALDTLKQVD